MIAQLKKLNKNRNKDNRGAALITVVIVLLFISILCTLILYISSVNYRMKKADYFAKVSFYSSEIPLENMESNLVETVSISYSYALQLTNANYVAKTVNDRKALFYQNFYDQLVKTLHATYSTEDIKSNECIVDIISALTEVPETNIYTGTDPCHNFNGNAFINTLSNNHKLDGTDGMAVNYIVLPRYDNNNDTDFINDFITLELIDPNTGNPYDDDHIRVVFHDIFVVTVENNTMSVIKTDIAVQLPPIDWAGGSGTTGREDFNANEMIFYVNWQKR